MPSPRLRLVGTHVGEPEIQTQLVLLAVCGLKIGSCPRFSRIAISLLFVDRTGRSRMSVKACLRCEEGRDSGQGIKGCWVSFEKQYRIAN